MRVLIIYPLGSEIKGPGIPNIIKILKLLRIKFIILTGYPFWNAYMPIDKDIDHSKVPMSELLLRINSKRPMTRLLTYLLEQLLLTFSIIRLRDSVDAVLFCYILSPIPLFTARVLGKKTITYVAGSPYLTALAHKSVFSFSVLLLEYLMYNLSDCIAVISGSLRTLPSLAKNGKKNFIAPIFLLNEESNQKFNFIINSMVRKNVVGFVGRFEEEKGVINFIKSIPLILSYTKNIRFLIIGEGSLKEEIIKELKVLHIENHVQLIGWVKDIENYLNSLKLIVLPSQTEGLPFIIFEAMACGAPVLSTPVGGIPEVIVDNETGFILESNNPPCIAEKIIELLNKPELLDKVSINAYRYIKENSSCKKTLEYWREIFNKIDFL